MRKIALSILTIAIFISLAYWLILDYQRTAQSTILATNQANDRAANNASVGNANRDESFQKALLPSSYVDTLPPSERSLSLELSSKLEALPSNNSITRKASNELRRRTDAITTPSSGPRDLWNYAKPLSILAVALLLGMLSGSLLWRRPVSDASDEFSWEQRTNPRLSEVEEAADHSQTDDAQPDNPAKPMEFRSNSATAVPENAHLNDSDLPSDVEAELYALREAVQSRQLELSEIETRLIDREATIEELRSEALNAGDLSSSLQQAQQHTAQLKEEVAERDETIKDLHDDIDNWRQQWSIHEEQRHELSEQTAQLTADKEALEKQLKGEHEALQKIEADNSGLADQAKRLSNDAERAAQLDNEIVELKDSLTQILVDNERLTREIETLSQRAADADELGHKVESQSHDIEVLLEERTKTENELTEALAAQHALKEEQQAGLDTINQQRTVNFQQNEQIEELSSHLSELEIQLDQSSGIATEHQQRLSDAQTTIRNLESEQHGLQQQLLEAKNDLDRQTSRNEELSQRIDRLETLNTESAQQLIDKEETLDLWQQKLNEQTQHSLTLDDQIESLHQQLQHNEQLQQTLKHDLEASNEIHTRLETWQNTLSTFQNDILAKNKLIDELHDAVNLSNERGDLLKAQIRDMDTQLEEYQDVRVELAQLGTIHDDFQNILSEQNCNFDTLQAETLQQNVNITNTQHQIDTVKRQAQTLHDEFGQATLRIELLETEKRRLQHALNELDTELELAISVSDLAIPLSVANSEQDQDAVLAKSRILTTAMETNQIAISQANARWRQAADKLAQQQEQIDQQSVTIAAQLSTIDEQLRSIEQAETATNDSAALLSERSESLAEQSAELAAYKENIESQAAQLNELNQRIETSNDELHAQNMKVEELNIALNAQTDAAKQLEETVSIKQTHIDELQQTLESQRHSALQQTTELSDEIQQLNQHLNGKLEEYETAQSELARLTQQLESEQHTIEKRRTDYNDLLEELVRQQTENEALSQASQNLQTQYDELVYQRQQLQSTIEQFDDQQGVNAEQLEHAEKLAQLRQEEIDDLHRQLAEKQQQMDAQQQAINQQAQNIERMELDLATAHRSQEQLNKAHESSADQYQKKIKSQESANRQARATAQKQAIRVQQLQQALQTQKLHNGKLANYIHQLRTKIEELKPIASPLPVLTNKVVAGDKPAEVPTLRQPLEPDKDNKPS